MQKDFAKQCILHKIAIFKKYHLQNFSFAKNNCCSQKLFICIKNCHLQKLDIVLSEISCQNCQLQNITNYKSVSFKKCHFQKNCSLQSRAGNLCSVFESSSSTNYWLQNIARRGSPCDVLSSDLCAPCCLYCCIFLLLDGVLLLPSWGGSQVWHQHE